MHCCGATLQSANSAAEPGSQTRCRDSDALWSCGKPSKPALLSFCKVLTHGGTPQSEFTCSAPNRITGDARCLLPLGSKTTRRETRLRLNRNWGDAACLGTSRGFILNEAQWLNFPSLPPWETHMSSPLDFLPHASADESRAGIVQLQHSHLQIRGWQGSSASFNYEWQPFISCLLIRWEDAICSLHVLSPLSFS